MYSNLRLYYTAGDLYKWIREWKGGNSRFAYREALLITKFRAAVDRKRGQGEKKRDYAAALERKR